VHLIADRLSELTPPTLRSDGFYHDPRPARAAANSLHSCPLEEGMAEKLNKISQRVTQPKSQGGSQAMLYATGLTEEDMEKAQVSPWAPRA
jgi:hypothetical protein